MRWTARLKLLLGVVLVLGIVAVATYHLNETRGRVESTSAQVLGQDLTVGAPYAGLVLDRRADVGTPVHKGDVLFVVDSATLALARSTGSRIPASTQVDGQGHLEVQATTDGTMTAVKAEPGTYVQAGDQLGTVERANSLYVEATFTLTPKEYARVPDKAPVQVLLPDGTTITGTVDHIRVTTVDGKAQAVATVMSPQLAEHGVVTAGAPVAADLTLRNDGWVTRAGDRVRALLERVPFVWRGGR
jgi:multidrug resistance efflux pump